MKKLIATIHYLLGAVLIVNVAFTWGQTSDLKDKLIIAFFAIQLLRMKVEADEGRVKARRAIIDLGASSEPNPEGSATESK